jgi:hypothetical protein
MVEQTTHGFLSQSVKIHFTRHEFKPRNTREGKALLKRLVKGKNFRIVITIGPDALKVWPWNSHASALDEHFKSTGWFGGSWKRFVFVDVVESVEHTTQSANLI